jgi:hypothetical protein
MKAVTPWRVRSGDTCGVQFPANWPLVERYDVKWQAIKDAADPFEQIDYGSILGSITRSLRHPVRSSKYGGRLQSKQGDFAVSAAVTRLRRLADSRPLATSTGHMGGAIAPPMTTCSSTVSA